MSIFKNSAAEFVYVRTYARWRDDLGRRESWDDTVDRFIDFIEKDIPNIPPKVIRKIKEYVYKMDVFPSMRLLWTAGPAVRKENVSAYNCAYKAIDSIESFAECLYILMNGTGFGFSVRKEEVDKLPVVPKLLGESSGLYVIEDSRAGWADSLSHLMTSLYAGKDVEMDYSKLRPKGAKLGTMGGRSSGPAPLISLHNYVREVFSRAQGRKLTTLECHDICCQIGDVVISGGVRRSAEISLSDLDDEEMRNAKVWPFPVRRSMANNSAIYNEKPNAVAFLNEWAALAASGTGERGIFNLQAAKNTAPKRRDASLLRGSNPCSEILLRDAGLCNLSEVVVRPDDDLDSMLDKVTTATWIGIIQSTLTNFPYLRDAWKKNAEEERLLGVSITGQMDNRDLLTEDVLKALKQRVLKTARHASKLLGINMPAATTTVKPSGTVSQLAHSASGLHPRYSKYYIRRYRISATDPLLAVLKDAGIKAAPEVGQRRRDWNKAAKGDRSACPIYVDGEQWSQDKVNTWVIEFPVASPKTSVTRDQVTALNQLEWYKHLQTNWAEHNCSITVYVKEDEWFSVGNWVYENWDIVNGISFLPYDGGKYELAPYEEITEEQYKEMAATMPDIDYSLLSIYESEDNTEGAQTYSCVGDKCELK